VIEIAQCQVPGIIPIICFLRSQIGEIDIDQAEKSGAQDNIQKVFEILAVFVFYRHWGHFLRKVLFFPIQLVTDATVHDLNGNG